MSSVASLRGRTQRRWVQIQKRWSETFEKGQQWVSSVLPTRSHSGLTRALSPGLLAISHVPHGLSSSRLGERACPRVGQEALLVPEFQTEHFLPALPSARRQQHPALFQASRAVALLHGAAQAHERAGRQQRGQRQAAQRLGQVFAVARLTGAATPDGRSDAYAQVLVGRVDGVVAGVARTRAASAAALAPLVTPGGLEGQGRGRVWPRP